MAKVYDKPINKHTPWDGDQSTGNLSVRGTRVEEFIKDSLNSKAGVFHYDTTNNRYMVFADAESRDEYLNDTTKTELIIGTFDAPFNYSAEITLSSPTYNAILAGTLNNYIDFTFDTKNKNGQSVGEDVIATFTFIRNGVKKTITERYRYGAAVHFKVDDYIDTGTNNVTVGIVGQNTLAATTVGVTYQVIDLKLSSTYDVSNYYNLATNPAATAAIPYAISGYGTKVMEWYLDGVLLDYVKVEDEIVDVSTTRTKYISVANLNQGKHSLQFRAYTIIDGERFYSNIIYHDLIVYTSANREPVIAVSAVIPTGNEIVTDGNLQLFGIQQYIPYELTFAVYNPTNAATTEAVISVDGKEEATVSTHNGQEETYSLRSLEYGVKTLTITAGNTIYTIGLNISKSTTTLEPITNGLVLDLQAIGKSNSDANREEWIYGLYAAQFHGFQWNKASGWNNSRLLISNGAYVNVNIAPFTPDPTILGRTLEFEFSTKNVSNDNAVICDLRNDNGTGLLITASEVTMKSAGGSTVTTKFKSNENIRVAFVINPKVGTVNKGMAFVYTDGICSGADSYSTTDNFTSAKTLKIGGTTEADVELKSLRFYNSVLNSDQILNNYILYRDTTDELLSVYDRNNIYESGTLNFSLDALAAQCPVLKVTGDIPTLENTTDKNMTIYVDSEYVNLQDPTKSFTTKGMRMRPQGTSSMGYPKKNFRIYTNYGTMYDYQGKVIENGLYSFKSGAQPVNCWCFKADYAESSGTHNTGVARLWNQVMYDAQINGQYLLRTQAQNAAIAAGYPYDVRTCVDGFPCHIVYRLTPESDWVYIGKYNFNNDKSTESVFGFRDIPGFDNSRMQCWEILNNGNHLALFEDMDNFDNEWDQAYEARYPDGSTDVSDLKSFSEWMVSMKGNLAKFKSEKWQHLDVYKVAAYYIYLMRFGAVDQVVKNAMLTSEDGEHFYFINYDNDTVIGVRNDGLLTYNYDITRQTIDETFEALVYAYAGHESTLWNNLEADDEFMQIVSEVDNALYMAGLTYAKTIDMFDVQQSGKWCERVYNQDSQYKYVGPFSDSGTNNLFMLQGARRAHRRWWLSHRFDLYDSLFVSGAYKAKSIEFKAANAPAGLKFSITAGSELYYGYGLNNVPIETGIHLTAGNSHEFTSKQVINVGDPVRIYSAVNIQELDVHNFISYLSTINISEVYGTEVGTKLKKLVMGVNTATDDRRNSSLSVISGLAQATRLEYLDISGYKSINNLDLSNHVNLTTLKAYESGLTGLVLANGGLISLMELPETLQAISLDSLPDLQASGLKVANEWKSVYSILIRNCNQLQAAPLIFSWYSKKTTADGQCSLVLDGIEWNNVDVANLISLGNIKKAGGTLSVKGIIHLSSITYEQVDQLKALFGENCFSPDNEIFITAPDGVFLNGPSEVLEGTTAQYAATVFSDYKGRVEFYLVNSVGSESSSIGNDSINRLTGLLTTGLTNSDRTFKIRAKHILTQGSVVVADMAISIKKRIYPSAGVINGASRVVVGDTDFTLEISNPAGAITGDYNVAWSITGDAVTQGLVRIKSQDKVKCVLNVTEVPADIASFTLTANVTNDFTQALVITKNIDIFMEGVIITKTTNTEIMKICYAQGWSANENYMTEEEAAAVTDIGIAFKSNSKIITFDEFKYFIGITNIPDNAFNNCYYITSIVLPPNITTIGSNVFYDCRALKTVDLPDSLMSIGQNLFYSCKNLIEVTIPNSVKTIGRSCFESCEKLERVTLPTSIENMDSYYFFRTCYALEKVTLPVGLTSLGSDMFAYCEALKQVSIPNTVTGTVYQSFRNCKSLQSIDLSRTTISSLYDYTFMNCTLLSDIKLPATLARIERDCFYKCSSLVSFVIPEGVTNIYEDAFSLSGIETIKINPNLKIKDCISYGAFASMNKLTSFTLDAGVIGYSIKDGILYDDTGTVLLCYPSGKIADVYTLPNEVIEIGSRAFSKIGKDVIGTFVFNKVLQKIGSSAFVNCNFLEGVIDLSDTQLNYIYAPFAGCPITRVIFPKTFSPTVENKCGYGALSEIKTLESYTVPDTTEFLQDSFLRSSGSVDNPINIVFPPNLKVIGESCFNYAYTNEEIIIPDTVTKLGNSIFQSCYNVKKIIARNVNDWYTNSHSKGNSIFYGCKKLETVVIGKISSIGSTCLSGCIALKSLTINASVAPEAHVSGFGNSTLDYVGRNTYDQGTNILYVPSGATGYDTGYWLDPLQNPEKCGFTISYTL